jgi:hypothetical protein
LIRIDGLFAQQVILHRYRFSIHLQPMKLQTAGGQQFGSYFPMEPLEAGGDKTVGLPQLPTPLPVQPD